MKAHELALKLLEGPNHPVATLAGGIEGGDLELATEVYVTDKETEALYAEDWEPDPEADERDYQHRLKFYNERVARMGSTGHVKYKKDAPKRSVVVVS